MDEGKSWTSFGRIKMIGQSMRKQYPLVYVTRTLTKAYGMQIASTSHLIEIA